LRSQNRIEQKNGVFEILAGNSPDGGIKLLHGSPCSSSFSWERPQFDGHFLETHPASTPNPIISAGQPASQGKF
jgi:hypothetical protein